MRFFGTLFLINFAMGVVTGIVQEFHFGMNWSEYARFMGDIFGAPLALEALTAFFLESTFLGIWMFGWDKLSPKLHCACIWLVALGSNLSAFWILVANSFMQHPVGYAIQDGRAEMQDFFALVTNHYVVGEYTHALTAGLTTTGVLILAISAWKYMHDKESRYAFTQTLKAGAIFLAVGVLGVEMEAAALYTLAAGAHVQALALFTVSDHLLTGEACTADERQTSFNDMIKIALETAIED